MGIESADSHGFKAYMSERFSSGYRLDSHARNIVEAIPFVLDYSPDDPTKYLLHYEEHVRKTYNADDADLCMKLSDPDAVAAFDAVIDEIRQNLEIMRKNRDAEIKKYAAKLRDIIDSKK